MSKTPAPWIVVTGLDGSGKSSLVARLAQHLKAHAFRLPYHEFVKAGLRHSGNGTPFGDVFTDRLIFAADARLANYLIHEWRNVHSCLVSQRAWMDNFVFAAVQGWSYAQTDALLHTADLERPTAAIFLIADPELAYERIRRDPYGDKFETRDFMRNQHHETLRFYRALDEQRAELAPFAGLPTTLIDTTDLDQPAVFDAARQFLVQHLPGVC